MSNTLGDGKGDPSRGFAESFLSMINEDRERLIREGLSEAEADKVIAASLHNMALR